MNNCRSLFMSLTFKGFLKKCAQVGHGGLGHFARLLRLHPEHDVATFATYTTSWLKKETVSKHTDFNLVHSAVLLFISHCQVNCNHNMAVSISPTRFLVTVAAMSATTINTERVDPLSPRRPDPVGVRHGVPQDCRGDGGRREPHYSVTHFLFQPWGF